MQTQATQHFQDTLSQQKQINYRTNSCNKSTSCVEAGIMHISASPVERLQTYTKYKSSL